MISDAQHLHLSLTLVAIMSDKVLFNQRMSDNVIR